MEQTMGAGDFKAKCLQVLDEVAQRREPLVITKRGRPVARLVPVAPPTALFGALAGSVQSEADIVAPLNVDWAADR